MRIGLISTLERSDDGGSLALLPFAGRTLIEWQASLLQDLGCGRIVCLVERLEDGLLPLQHRLEQDGIGFHAVRGPHQLLGLATADDEIVALADGLLVDRDLAGNVLGEGRAIAAIDVEAGMAAGFQRIDAEWAWAGMMVVRASLLERLAELPPDADAIASLLRLALQSGVPKREVDEDTLSEGALMLAGQAEALAKQERRFLDSGLDPVPRVAPGLHLAARLARYLAGRTKPVGSGTMLGIAAIYLAVAGILAWYDIPAAALAIFALGSLSATIAVMLDTLASRLWSEKFDERYAGGFNIFLDGALVALVSRPWIDPVWSVITFASLATILALRLAAELDRAPWRTLWRDRIALAAVLAVAAMLDLLEVAVVSIALATLLYVLLRVRSARLTRA